MQAEDIQIIKPPLVEKQHSSNVFQCSSMFCCNWPHIFSCFFVQQCNAELNYIICVVPWLPVIYMALNGLRLKIHVAQRNFFTIRAKGTFCKNGFPSTYLTQTKWFVSWWLVKTIIVKFTIHHNWIKNSPIRHYYRKQTKIGTVIE